jgi:hypothetical protein
MAQREKTFKKPSYKVNKRILERYMRVKMGENGLRNLDSIVSPVRDPMLG